MRAAQECRSNCYRSAQTLRAGPRRRSKHVLRGRLRLPFSLIHFATSTASRPIIRIFEYLYIDAYSRFRARQLFRALTEADLLRRDVLSSPEQPSFKKAGS